MTFHIRPYHPSDLPSLYKICLQTGYRGQDASPYYSDPLLLGHIWAAPYAILEPDLCFILTLDHAPIGYVLGTRDGDAFAHQCESDWFPPLRKQYKLRPENDMSHEAEQRRLLHRGHNRNNSFPHLPAQLHIDILPEGQGKGQGGKLMGAFLDRLRSINAPGVQLGVDIHNTNAIGFYKHIGFEEVVSGSWGYVLGMQL